MAKTILITGAGTGLGKGTAIGLAKAGHRVVATVENWPQVTALKQETAGLNIVVDKLDYANEADHDSIITKYANDVDVFVANAAIGETGPAAEIPLERYRNVFEINVFRTLELTQKFAAVFAAKNKGKIIAVSSTAGLRPYPFLAPYTASKHALEAIFQLLRIELAPLGVKVATINPGPFNTGFNNRMYETVDQWFDANVHFTPEKELREMQAQFNDPDFQLDPELMIEVMVDTIAKDNHDFRTAYPKEFADDTITYQASLWSLKA